MKKLAIALVTFFLLVTMGTTVSARTDRAPYELSGALAFGTGPEDFDDDFGLTLGAGYMLNNIDKNLQARIDVSFFTFERDVPGATLEYTRIPVNISGRYYFPMVDRLDLFAEAGIEASFDDVDLEDSEVNVGFTPGGGAEYFINDTVSVFALGRFHIITDDYFSMHFGGAYHF